MPQRHLVSQRTVSEAIEAARILEAQGRHAEASSLFAPIWLGVGTEPDVESLTPHEQADVLLRVSAITGNYGATVKLNAQVQTRSYLLRALSIYCKLKDSDGQAEALSELAYAERRLGNIRRAQRLVRRALGMVSADNRLLLAAVQLRRAIIEQAAENYAEVFSIFHESAHLFDAPLDEGQPKDIRKLSLVGIFFNMRGILHRSFALKERSWEYFDAGYADITAAQFFFHSAGHKRYEAAALNNLALFAIVHRDFDKAHEYVDRARHLLTLPSDLLFVAQVEETRARVFGAERRFDDAERTIEQAVALLTEAGDASAFLRDMLVIRDTIFAARTDPEQAENILKQVRPQLRLVSGGATPEKPAREVVTFRIEADNDSLQHLGFNPGDVVPFESTLRAHEGQFVLACIMPGTEFYAGFYHPNADGRTVMIDTGHLDYEPQLFPLWRVQVRGVHRTLQRVISR